MTNQEIVRAWIKESRKKLKHKHKKIYFDSPERIYSFGKHYVMARRADEDLILVQENAYSKTTSQHRTLVFKEARKAGYKTLEVPEPDVSVQQKATKDPVQSRHQANLVFILDKIIDGAGSVMRARSLDHSREVARPAGELKFYADRFAVGHLLTKVMREILSLWDEARSRESGVAWVISYVASHFSEQEELNRVGACLTPMEVTRHLEEVERRREEKQEEKRRKREAWKQEQEERRRLDEQHYLWFVEGFGQVGLGFEGDDEIDLGAVRRHLSRENLVALRRNENDDTPGYFEMMTPGRYRSGSARHLIPISEARLMDLFVRAHEAHVSGESFVPPNYWSLGDDEREQVLNAYSLNSDKGARAMYREITGSGDVVFGNRNTLPYDRLREVAEMEGWLVGDILVISGQRIRL